MVSRTPRQPEKKPPGPDRHSDGDMPPYQPGGVPEPEGPPPAQERRERTAPDPGTPPKRQP